MSIITINQISLLLVVLFLQLLNDEIQRYMSIVGLISFLAYLLLFDI